MPTVPDNTARLDIANFHTTLYVRNAAGEFSRHSIDPDVSYVRDGRFAVTADFQAEADKVLGELGLSRTGDWSSSGGEWAAPIAVVEV